MKNPKSYWYHLLPYTSSVLLYLAFYKFGLGLIALIALVPLITYFSFQDKLGLRKKTVLINVWLAGLVHFLLLFSWMIQTDPITWTPVEGTDKKVIKYLIYVVVALFYSLSWLAIGWITLKWKVFSNKPITVTLVFTLIWIVLEFTRSYLFSWFMYEGNATIGAHWNFGTLAFSGAVTPLAFASRLIGFYGLSALVIFSNFAVFYFFQKKYSFSLAMLIFIIFVPLFGWSFYADSSEENIIHASALQINDDLSDKYLSSLNESPSVLNSRDLIVLPEYSKFFNKDAEQNEETSRNSILKNISNSRSVIVTSISDYTEQAKITNNLIYFNNQAEVLAEYEKTFLIPGGEYLPTWPRALMKAAGHSALVDDFNKNRALKKGSKPEQPIQTEFGLIGSLVCSGVISPQLYQQLSNNSNPGVITNSASLNIFADAANYHEQTKQMARFHAIANNKPYVQSTRDGISQIISSDGDILAESFGDEKAYFINSEIEPNYKQTVYTKTGNILLLISSIALVAWLVINYPKKKQLKTGQKSDE